MPRKPRMGEAPTRRKAWSPAPWPPLCLLASIGGRLKNLKDQFRELLDDSPPGLPTWRVEMILRSVNELRTIHAVLSTKMGVKDCHEQGRNGSEE
jgi:hypothetical protein